MNGRPLPALNGFPARLVVPGWYATYWVKCLHRITVLPHRFDGYWMAKAYHIPATPNGVEDPRAKSTGPTVPISRMNVRSLFTSPEPGATLAAGRPVEVAGIAFDGGSGIRQRRGLDRRRLDLGRGGPGRGPGPILVPPLAASLDPGVAGRAPAPVPGHGRRWPGAARRRGWNRGGYMRNVIEEVSVHVT